MKRIFLTLFAAGLASGLFAQSVDKVKDLLKTNKLAEAKTEVDALLATPKGQKNAEAWYQKVKVYNAIAVSDQMKASQPDALGISLEALKKYAEMDDKKLVSLTMDQYKPVNEIYQGLFKTGADNYNAAKYPEALYDFTTALDAIKYMNGKGWIKQNMDTTSTLYAGISAEKSQKRDTAVIYYKTIVDSGITKINGNSMEEIFKWVADYYDKKGDRPNADKYIALGKKNFPGDLFYDELDLDRLRKSPNKDSLWAKYETINKDHPDSAIYFFNYALELYQYSSDSTKGPLPSNAAELTSRAQEKMGKSLSLNPNYPQANLVMGQILYNQGIETQAKTKTVKGTKPEDIKARAALRNQAMGAFDKAIPYFEKVDQQLGKEGKLKMAEKSALRDSYDLLVTIYEQKRDQAKVAAWTDKYNNVDKVH